MRLLKTQITSSTGNNIPIIIPCIFYFFLFKNKIIAQNIAPHCGWYRTLLMKTPMTYTEHKSIIAS